jgi:CelD/BcsL family acetyltransferase involved in cellulose biosynthesis
LAPCRVDEEVMSINQTVGSMNVTVRLHRRQDELASIRDVWDRMSVHPNSDPDHVLLVCRLRSEVIAPCVFSVWVDGACTALVVARLERGRYLPKIGYLRLPSFEVRSLVVLNGGLLGTVDSTAVEAVMGELLAMLARGEADVVRCSTVAEDSPLLNAIRGCRSSTIGITRPRWTAHWEMDVEANPGFLVERMKAKHRSWFRRKAGELDKAMSGEVQWSYHKSDGDVAALCESMETVAKRTYQRGLGAGFRDDLEHRERLGLFSRRGMLRAIVAHVNGKPLAFWYGIRYGNVFHSSATGYLTELHVYEIGTQMFVRLVDILAAEGVTRFDFGLGGAAYKQRFGTRSRQECDACIFPRTFNGSLLWLLMTACANLDRSLSQLVSQLGLVDRVKKAWRRRLVGQGGRQKREKQVQK